MKILENLTIKFIVKEKYNLSNKSYDTKTYTWYLVLGSEPRSSIMSGTPGFFVSSGFVHSTPSPELNLGTSL